MSISKVKSKKYGTVYQVDIRYKDRLGMSERHIKSGFIKMKDARKYEKDFLDKIELDRLNAKECLKTFNDVFKEYMELEGKNKYANATMHYYNATHQMYIAKSIGELKIGTLKYINLQRYFNELSKKQNIPTLKNVKKTLAVTFKYALRVGYIKENPIPLIQLPKDDRERVIVKTIEDNDLQKIINNIQKVKRTNPYPNKENAKFTAKAYAMALFIGRYTGLRISEVLALKKTDFDLENNQLTIQRKIEYMGLKNSEMYLTDKLKSKSSKSTVEISRILSNQMKKWFEINPYDYVICDGKGQLVHPEKLNKRIRDVSKDLGIKFHFHMLRHTYATELMMSGVNPVVVKDLLRHSEVNTTWSIYTHPSNEDQREALDDLYMKMK